MDVISPSDPRVRVELVFHPKGRKPVTICLPRYDYLDEDSFRSMMAAVNALAKEQKVIFSRIHKAQRDYNVKSALWRKQVNQWQETLDKGEDPGEFPEEPAEPELVGTEELEESLIVRRAALARFRHVLSDSEYQLLEKCTTGELRQAATEWEAKSNIPLGELLASRPSSTESMGAPSVTTSLLEDSGEKTSVIESPGETSKTS